ncbi:unannotated protein [freshwater metagenome]|uniref:Unannotated protein n=1 Tax=freshwater metagenome TaxID=449393 RepID=A0A6J6I1G8_9ZZZZ
MVVNRSGRRHDDETIDLFLQKSVDCLAFDGNVFVGVRDDHLVATVASGIDDSLGGAVEKDVGEVGNYDQTDGLCVAGSHRLGDGVRLVSEL